jgi:MFS family permease
MSKSYIGIFLSFSFFLLFTGTIIAGYIVDRINKKKTILVIAILLSVLILIGMSFIKVAFHLVITTSILWFSVGFQMVMINIFQSDKTQQTNRGSKFGQLIIINGLGAIFGGLVIGTLLKKYSSEVMFLTLSGIALISFCCSLFLQNSKKTTCVTSKFKRFNKKIYENKRLLYFYMASVILSIVNYMILLSVSLYMKENEYSNSQISFAVVWGLLFSLPVTYLIGKLSDKKSRKKYIFMTFLSGTIAILLLLKPISLIVFIIIVFFKSIMSHSRNAVSYAFVIDFTAPKNLGKVISYLGSTTWIGGALSYIFVGNILQHFGYLATIIIGAVLSIIALLIVNYAFKFPQKTI